MSPVEGAFCVRTHHACSSRISTDTVKQAAGMQMESCMKRNRINVPPESTANSDAAKDNAAAIRYLQICRRSSCSEQSIIRTPPYIFQNNIK